MPIERKSKDQVNNTGSNGKPVLSEQEADAVKNILGGNMTEDEALEYLTKMLDSVGLDINESISNIDRADQFIEMAIETFHKVNLGGNVNVDDAIAASRLPDILINEGIDVVRAFIMEAISLFEHHRYHHENNEGDNN